MARKKYEFRPDKEGSGILQKLYITKKQRLALLRWGLFAAVLLALSVLQDVIFSRLRIFGAVTDLMPCAILLICLLLGAERGSVFTLIASALYLFSGSSPGYYVMALLVGLGIGVSLLRQNYLQQGFGAALLCVGSAMVLYEMTVFAVTLVMGRTAPDRVFVFLVTAALSVAAIPVLYPILSGIDKIGGEVWTE